MSSAWDKACISVNELLWVLYMLRLYDSETLFHSKKNIEIYVERNSNASQLE